MAKILIVEDDTNIAFGLEHDLKLEGYEIEVASDGEMAIERASEGAFDLIILDRDQGSFSTILLGHF